MIAGQIVLYAEDDENDAFFMQRAFRKLGRSGDLRIVHNGQEAKNYLLGAGAYADRLEFPIPDLLLLDIKMPEMTGLEVLQWVRRQPEYKALNVVMLTSSIQPADIAFCKENGADAYLAKSSRFDLLDTLMSAVLAARAAKSSSQRRLDIPGNLLPALDPGDA
jgi:CheY-like chemotaxis protein